MPKIKLHEDNPNSVRVGEPVTIRATVRGEQLRPVTRKIDGTVTAEQLLPVTWKIDGNVVTSNENIDILEQGDLHSITIKKADPRPGRSYKITITAYNRLGEDTKDTTVTVHGKYNTIIKGRPFDSL